MTRLAHAFVAGVLLALLPCLAHGQDTTSTPSPGDTLRPPDSGLTFDPREGIAWENEDGSIRLRPRLLLALDYRHYDARNVRKRTGRLDRALAGVEGTLDEWISFRVLGDLRGTDTRYGLEQAWVSLDLHDQALRVVAGLVRFTPGVEHSFPEQELPWVDYAAPAQLTGAHDLGVLLEGQVADGLLGYQLGVGAGEGFDSFGQRRNDAKVHAKLMLYPLRWLDLKRCLGPYHFPLNGLFLSVAMGASWDFRGYFDSATALRNKLFSSIALRAKHTRHWHVAYGIDLGPIRIVHELGRLDLFDVRLLNGGREDFKNNEQSAMAIALWWRITGEPYDSRLYTQRFLQTVPERPLTGPGPDDDRRGALDFEQRSDRSPIGTLELAVRYMNTERDRDLFLLGFTDFNRSSQEWRALDVALVWRPVRTLRIALHMTRVIADTARPGGSGIASPGVFENSPHGRDTSFAFRLALQF